MKATIHPTMHKDAKTNCTTCGAIYLIPSTVKEQTVETCRMCHPVYTGKQLAERRGGRIDRFKARLEKGAEKKK